MPAIRGINSKKKTRRRLRDIDQVYEDLKDGRHLELYKSTKAVEDLPGLGEHYCIECAKWFESETNLESHKKSKVHKRQVKKLKGEPYTQKEAEAATGQALPDNGPRKTVPMEEDKV